MKQHDEEMLNHAIEALKSSHPGDEAVAASAGRIADRLGIAVRDGLAAGVIENCDDVRQLLAAYRAGTLTGNRALLVEAHLHDCGACLRRFRSGASVDWSAPAVQSKKAWSSWWGPVRLGWALACTAALAACTLFVYRMYWAVPPGVRAEVQSVDGSAYLISGANGRQLAAGAQLREGDLLRTAGGSRAVLKLSDGSTVEVSERSVLGVGARGRNMTVALDGGALIVQAAKRTSGHLYVRTPDCRVAVTGTVFSVDSGIKGSRVAVLQGNVKVMHAGIDTMLHAGDQLATSENLQTEPLGEQFAWSQDREKYLGLVAQFATLQQRIGKIPFPEPRYSSDLLDRVPADTLLYISIPNLGEFLSQANTIFQDQLSQSPELQQWWSRGHNNTADLEALVDKLHEVSQYLGNEVVVIGVREADHPGFAVLANVERNGLDELLKERFSLDKAGKLTVLDERALSAAAAAKKTGEGAYALVRDHEAVFAGDIAILKELNAQLNAGASGFASGDFGKQIAAAYGRGAGIILAADLHQMWAEASRRNTKGPRTAQEAMADSGFANVNYLIAEHREVNGAPENHLNLQFTGARQHVASWLAAPAPIGSLDFVSANAALAVAGLSKAPKEIADDLVAMAAGNRSAHETEMSEGESEFETTVREEIAPNLGGDFLMALDGPVLPTPSWKLVIEVHDSNRLEQAMEHLVQLVDEQRQDKNFKGVAIDAGNAGAQRYYAIRDVASGNIMAQYTFADGFMIIAPDRALLMEALRTHASGGSLARSVAFKQLLPKDDSENCSAVAYQNLSPVLNPLLQNLNGDSAAMLRKLAQDSHPTAVCAWGRENRIEAASDSRLFGFDFLTLGALLDSRNKPAPASVKE